MITLIRFILCLSPSRHLIGWLLVILCSPAVQADVYKYVDKYGRVHLTDRPKHSGYKLVLRSRKGRVSRSFKDYKKNRARFSPTIEKAAQQYQLSQALLHAVITAESAYDPKAVSTAGAVGLMQLMPGTARRYGVSNRKDPVANVSGGSRYLRDLLAMFDNNVELALAAYNAGEHAVKKYGNRSHPTGRPKRT